MHNTGIGDENNNEWNERIDDKIHPREIKCEKIIVRFFRRSNQIRTAHGQHGFLRSIAGKRIFLLLFGAKEDQIMQIEKEKDRINDDQGTVRMSMIENILIPNDSSCHRCSFERNGAKDPHSAMREITGDEFVGSTEIN